MSRGQILHVNFVLGNIRHDVVRTTIPTTTRASPLVEPMLQSEDMNVETAFYIEDSGELEHVAGAVYRTDAYVFGE